MSISLHRKSRISLVLPTHSTAPPVPALAITAPESQLTNPRGTTIGGYAGICGAQNVQVNSDDYFHVKEFELMIAYIAGDGNCGTQTALNNNPPVPNAARISRSRKQRPLHFTGSATIRMPEIRQADIRVGGV